MHAFRLAAFPSEIRLAAERSEASNTQGLDVCLIGAGDSAGHAALFFASYARTVTLLVGGDALEKSMSHYLLEQVRGKQNVHVLLRTEVTAFHGDATSRQSTSSNA